MLYLNDSSELKGGATNFLIDRAGRKTVLAVVPRVGSAIIFRPTLWHEGEELIPSKLRGEKFILRSDLLYRRVASRLPGALTEAPPDQPTSGTLAQPLLCHSGYVWSIQVFQVVELHVVPVIRPSSCGQPEVNIVEEAAQLTGANCSVLALAYVPCHAEDHGVKRGFLVSGNRGRAIRVWPVTENAHGVGAEVAVKHDAHDGSVLCLHALRANLLFASGGGDGALRIWSLANVRSSGVVCVASIDEAHGSWIWNISSAVFIPAVGDGQDCDKCQCILATAGEDATFKIWKLSNSNRMTSTGSLLRLKQIASVDVVGPVSDVCFLDNNGDSVAAARRGGVSIYTGILSSHIQVVRTIVFPHADQSIMRVVVMLPLFENDTILAVAGEDNRVHIVSINQEIGIRCLNHANYVHALLVHADSLFAACYDGVVRRWPLCALHCHNVSEEVFR